MPIRLVRFVLFVAVVLFGHGCTEYSYLNVVIVSAPDHVAPGDTAVFVVTTNSNYSPTFQLRVDWNDGGSATRSSCVVGDTYRLKHVWHESGIYHVAASANQQGFAYDTVLVSGANDPVIDSAVFFSQRRPVTLALWARDPAGDSVRFSIDWGDGERETTAFAASPACLRPTHRYATPGYVTVVFRALDKSGAMSFADSLSGVASPTGEVISIFLAEGETFTGSPVVAAYGDSEYIYVVGSAAVHRVSRGGGVSIRNGSFSGDPSYSSDARHLYVGTDDGRLYAFTADLALAWSYPDSAGESIPASNWSPVAVRGVDLYAGRDDSLFHLVDNGAGVTLASAIDVSGRLASAPTLDAAGNVYASTDSGYLYKLTPAFELGWRVRLQFGGGLQVALPDAAGLGIVHCPSDSGRLYAVNASDGGIRWTAHLDGACATPALSSEGMYIGTSSGVLYKLDPVFGSAVWSRRLDIAGIATAPMVAAGGSVYVQTESDRLYCVEQSSGDTVWVSDCPAYLPRGGTPRLSSGVASPAIDGQGKVWIVGAEAIYRVSCYSPLDPTAPWPKWQHDKHNTGYVGGGR